MSCKKMIISPIIIFAAFIFGQPHSLSLAQTDDDILQKEADIEEQLQMRTLKRLQQENPEGMSDEQLEENQDELEASQRDLDASFQKQARQSEDAVDEMLDVDETDPDWKRPRLVLPDEENEFEQDAPATRSRI